MKKQYQLSEFQFYDGEEFRRVAVIRFGTCYPELLHERYETRRSLRRTRHRQRNNQSPQSKHTSEIL